MGSTGDHGTTPRVAVHDRHMAERAALLPALPGVIGSIHEVIIMGMPMRLNFYMASRI
jgi:hypothetical protein